MGGAVGRCDKGLFELVADVAGTFKCSNEGDIDVKLKIDRLKIG